MTELTPISRNQLQRASLMQQAGQQANAAAARHVFEDYNSRKAANTIRRHRADLTLFAYFLGEIDPALYPTADMLEDPETWRGVTWGIVEAYRSWMLTKGYSVTTINFHLSTVKVYAALATKAGVIPTSEYAMIKLVKGYNQTEGKHVDERREESGQATRLGSKKEQPVRITQAQARKLKAQPDTPQGRRDSALMCVLLDHGLRCGEVARLTVEDIDLQTGVMHFYRPKVDKHQQHRLTKDSKAAITAYLADHPGSGPLLLASKKGGKLDKAGMSERAITKRVEYLGEQAGIIGLSAHDCRHFWATQAARHHTPLERLADAGGWSNLSTPKRYIESAKIANDGVSLGDE